MLPYSEVKRINQRYKLPCKAIYRLHSEYSVMQGLTRRIREKLARDLLTMQSGKQELEDHLRHMEASEDVPIRVMIKVSPLFKEKILSITHRLFIAFGIELDKEYPTISWEEYLKLSMILNKELGSRNKKESINLWISFFDPRLTGICSRKDCGTLIETLARGNISQTPTEISEESARKLWRIFDELNLLGENQEGVFLDTVKLRNALTHERLDVMILNQFLDVDNDYVGII